MSQRCICNKPSFDKETKRATAHAFTHHGAVERFSRGVTTHERKVYLFYRDELGYMVTFLINNERKWTSTFKTLRQARKIFSDIKAQIERGLV